MRLFLLSLLAFVSFAAPAHALQIVKEIDSDGDPLLYAPGDNVTWQACLGADCWSTDGNTLHAGDNAAGTVFTATAGGESASTPAWGGRVSAPDFPTIAGNAVVGGTVHPVAAHWTGGWGNEVDDLRIEACRVTVCRTISAPDWVSGGARDGSVTIGPELAGTTLRVADRRRNLNEVRPMVVYTDPGDVPTLSPAQLVLFGATSPFIDASDVPPVFPTVSAPDVAPLDPFFSQPSAILRKRAIRSKSGLIVGMAACRKTCAIRLSVDDGHHTFTRSWRDHGKVTLALSRSAKPRKGTLRVKVTADGKTLANGRVKL